MQIDDRVSIVRSGDRQDAARCVPTLEERFVGDLRARRLPKLSVLVRGLKSAVSKQVHQIDRDFAWQPRYHDHAIRKVKDMNNISNYIENNVLT
ncbi:MAG: transposase [Paludibacteraceae bacterium]|nr:transposase [Paludibacteraceae bacterium]